MTTLAEQCYQAFSLSHYATWSHEEHRKRFPDCEICLQEQRVKEDPDATPA